MSTLFRRSKEPLPIAERIVFRKEDLQEVAPLIEKVLPGFGLCGECDRNKTSCNLVTSYVFLPKYFKRWRIKLHLYSLNTPNILCFCCVEEKETQKRIYLKKTLIEIEPEIFRETFKVPPPCFIEPIVKPGMVEFHTPEYSLLFSYFQRGERTKAFLEACQFETIQKERELLLIEVNRLKRWLGKLGK